MTSRQGGSYLNSPPYKSHINNMFYSPHKINSRAWKSELDFQRCSFSRGSRAEAAAVAVVAAAAVAAAAAAASAAAAAAVVAAAAAAAAVAECLHCSYLTFQPSWFQTISSFVFSDDCLSLDNHPNTGEQLSAGPLLNGPRLYFAIIIMILIIIN